MAHAFKIIPAKPTFGTLNQVVYQGDYIKNKKAKLIYCDNRNKYNCNKLTKASNYNMKQIYSSGRYLNAVKNGCILPFNKADLIAGQYTKMNLKNVCTVINGSPCVQIDSCTGCLTAATIDINSSEPFNQTNTIDPVGSLFGKSACGTNNFTRYMVL